MRYGLVLLLVCSMSVHADAYKCQGPAGQTIFSDIPCERIEKVRPSESGADPAVAKSDLDRQRAYINSREAQKATTRQQTSGASFLPDESNPPSSFPPPRPVSPSSTMTH
ncbi:DUF4124 domain-containing protein [Quatrionicoccus australiensis]|uniref:DUF4124 domain-containing protein n=1 Tax=Quatrionicoccus australiensis TaxID=138118 RepID=UPI001CFB5EA4|nr:DUF4124 domain-containing protein [Quatrionicoccus australiensis]MCB4360284.1 DUF4124 domain-containing protein [Quatrionicoccus australiensis]